MKRLFLLLAAAAALGAAACSGGGSGITPPPPTGGFTNASLKGTYVFSMSGRTIDQNFGVSNFARIGTFIADGLGNISNPGGIEDVHIFGSDNIFAFTGGSYTVNADGRGTLSLINSSGTSQYSITLASSSSGYIVAMPTDGSSTASGNFQLQSATTLASNTYTFDFSGIVPDDTGNPVSIIGEFTPNGACAVSCGVTNTSFEDVNDNGNFITKASLSGGTLTTDNANPGSGRGTATLGGLDYVFYVIDDQHVQFMAIDQDPNAPGTALGEAAAQQAGVPNNVSAFNNSNFVFVMGGSSGAGPVTRAGRLTASGGNLSAILLDNNNAGQSVQVPLLNTGTITLDGDNSGRGTMTFTDTATHTGTYTFVFYLNSASQGVIQDVSAVLINNVPSAVDVADGNLAGQSGAPFTSSSFATNYAITWSGVTSDEEDLVGHFAPATTGSNGLADWNEFGNGKQFTSVPLNGVITLGGDGTGSTGKHTTFVATLQQPTVNPVNFFAYIADANTIYIMATGTQRVALGVLTAQNP